YHVAADEEILLRAEGQASRTAKLHGIGGLDCRGKRIYTGHTAVLHIRTDLRDRHKEAAEIGIPDRLFGSILGINPMRRVEGYPLADRQLRGALIDADQGAEGR